jgi:hypothetical protein
MNMEIMGLVRSLGVAWREIEALVAENAKLKQRLADRGNGDARLSGTEDRGKEEQHDAGDAAPNVR